ncbi:flagella synthesis protein FlgN [Iodobacter ciconiae]|uniref:Flagellar protein FlgN n=1 Tax=Iodobacter ciconiae TaxID=2496266 RepID=A0A3S8ZSP1_9NEIS|nr:flagellar protein FlgN [Iodobacter ciconiae]AZN36533.1 flagellar protein FlgN [Iodobacter ciconiae]
MTINSPLDGLLTQAISSMQALLGLLKKEQNYLVANQLDPLLVLTTEKQAMAVDAEQAGQALSQFFAAQGGDPQNDVSRWFTEQHPDALGQWQALLEITRQAAAFNSSNGQLIETRQQLINGFMQQILDSSHNRPLYAPDGKLTSLPQGQKRDLA